MVYFQDADGYETDPDADDADAGVILGDDEDTDDLEKDEDAEEEVM